MQPLAEGDPLEVSKENETFSPLVMLSGDSCLLRDLLRQTRFLDIKFKTNKFRKILISCIQIGCKQMHTPYKIKSVISPSNPYL